MKTALRRQQTEVSGVRPAPRTPQSESRLAHASFPSRHPSSVSGPPSSVLRPPSSVLRPQSSVLSPQSSVLSPPSSVLRPSLRGFTMVEIAISLAVIGFALVAIVGILPIGMGVQKENRQETIINQDATVFLDAIRNGAMGLDDLTNYVMAITNYVTEYDQKTMKPISALRYGYTPTSSSTSPQFPLVNGARIVGLLSTPKYVPLPGGIRGGGSTFYSNHVVAYVRSMSGPASEKYPQSSLSIQDLAFSYRLVPEVVPNQYLYNPDQQAVNLQTNLQNNLHELRLTFRWPLLNQGAAGPDHQVFRTIAGGFLSQTNELVPASAHPESTLYFFQPRNYVKASP